MDPGRKKNLLQEENLLFLKNNPIIEKKRENNYE